MVLKMVRVIWRELRKVRVDLENAYVSEDKMAMFGQYLQRTLQAHRIMEKFLHTQF